MEGRSFCLVVLFVIIANSQLLWPKPKYSEFGNKVVFINPDILQSSVPSNYIINKGFERYYEIFFPFISQFSSVSYKKQKQNGTN